MDPESIVHRVSDGHTSKDRCADCRKYKGQFFFVHCYDSVEWAKFLYNPLIANDLFITEYDSKSKDSRKLVFEGQPPMRLILVRNCQTPQYVLTFLKDHFGKQSPAVCSVWTIKP